MAKKKIVAVGAVRKAVGGTKVPVSSEKRSMASKSAQRTASPGIMTTKMRG